VKILVRRSFCVLLTVIVSLALLIFTGLRDHCVESWTEIVLRWRTELYDHSFLTCVQCCRRFRCGVSWCKSKRVVFVLLESADFLCVCMSCIAFLSSFETSFLFCDVSVSFSAMLTTLALINSMDTIRYTEPCCLRRRQQFNNVWLCPLDWMNKWNPTSGWLTSMLTELQPSPVSSRGPEC